MSATTLGTAHLWGIQAGIGAVTSAVVQSYSVDKTTQNEGTTINEVGNQIEDRGDDEVLEGSITLKIEGGYTEPSLRDVITYDGYKFWITNVGRAESNSDHVVLTLGIKSTEYITLP